ncbi:MAG: DUF2085 domain-containing protein [Candidatus Micrarchaeia archaeon]
MNERDVARFLKLHRGYILYVPFLFYTAIMLVFDITILITPYLAMQGSPLADIMYSAFAPTCHQKASRSFCLFEKNSALYLDDCIEQAGKFVSGDSKITRIEKNGTVGYKFPVCARDMSLYIAMLIGAFAFALLSGPNSTQIPSKMLLFLAVIPLAIDGSLQFISAIGFSIPIIGHYESTNLVRAITGALAGFALSFYILPITNSLVARTMEL